MTEREKLVELLAQRCEIQSKGCVGCKSNWPGAADCKQERFARIADHLLANGVTVRPSPQNNHHKICPTTGLECIECVPGSPCANLEQELEKVQRCEPMTR